MGMLKQLETLITESELCAMLRVSRVTVWRLRRRGLPRLRVGGQWRYNARAVRKWLEREGIKETA